MISLRKSNTKEFIAKAMKLYPNYGFSKVKYINNKIKVIITHPDGHEFSTTPNEFLRGKSVGVGTGNGIDSASGKRRCTQEAFIFKAMKICSRHSFSKVVYTNNKTKVIIICPEGHEFPIMPSEFLRGKGCPECNSSKGETAINKWLLERDISFDREKEFPNLIGLGNGYLRFDFDVYDKKGNLLFLL